MRVFVTGATGFIGSRVVKELIDRGHEVLGLSRSQKGDQLLLELGAKIHRGDLVDTESLKSGARECDGVIHTGFIHDFTKFKENCEIDRKAILAMGEILEATEKPLIITSGIGLLSGKLSSEEDRLSSDNTHPRAASERAADELSAKGVHVSVVRLPPSVHGKGDHGFVPMLINFAREKGVSGYLDEGNNKWPAVHRFDAARLFVLALEKGRRGAYYHGVTEEGIPFKEIANVIGRRLNVSTASKTGDEAAQYFTWFLHFASMDCPSLSKKTQDELGWKPREVSLLQDIDGPEYFTET